MLVEFDDFPQGGEHFLRCPTVKPPFALFEVQMKGLFGDAIELSEMTFRLVPEVFNAVDVVAFRGGKCLRVIDTDMVIPLDMQAVVAPEGIRVDDAVWHNPFFDDGHQCLCLGIPNDLSVDLPSALQDAKDRHLPRSAPTTFSFASATEVTLIHLHFSVERPLPLQIGRASCRERVCQYV